MSKPEKILILSMILLIACFMFVVYCVVQARISDVVSYNSTSFEDNKGRIVPFEYIIIYERRDGKFLVTWSFESSWDVHYLWVDKTFIKEYELWREGDQSQ